MFDDFMIAAKLSIDEWERLECMYMKYVDVKN